MPFRVSHLVIIIFGVATQACSEARFFGSSKRIFGKNVDDHGDAPSPPVTQADQPTPGSEAAPVNQEIVLLIDVTAGAQPSQQQNPPGQVQTTPTQAHTLALTGAPSDCGEWAVATAWLESKTDDLSATTSATVKVTILPFTTGGLETPVLRDASYADAVAFMAGESACEQPLATAPAGLGQALRETATTIGTMPATTAVFLFATAKTFDLPDVAWQAAVADADRLRAATPQVTLSALLDGPTTSATARRVAQLSGQEP